MKCLNLCQKQLISVLQVRWASKNYKLKDEIENSIEREEYKPKKHPGIVPYKTCDLPNWLHIQMKENLTKFNKADLIKESIKFTNYLRARCVPLEDNEINQIYINFQKELMQKEFDGLLDNQDIETDRLIKRKALRMLKSTVYNWQPIKYNKMKSLIYMIARASPEYSTLITIFNEIKVRDPDFNPKTLLDFGSGIGSVLWAATNIWENINEYMGVDISNDMNDLSQNIIQGSPSKVKSISYRQYLPLSNLPYDIIVSAYSFMELPNARQRLEAIQQLWKKTNKYLVIIEQGTNAGFKVMNEFREFIDYMSKHPKFKSKYFIFAPCPHKMPCPRLVEDSTPCNFLSHYLSPFIKFKSHKSELFTYLIFKKGEPSEHDSWSRVVRSTIIKKGHVVCKLCTSSGKLENLIFSKKRGNLFKCAKSTEWGDRLPIETCNIEEISSEKEERTNSKF